MRFAAVAVLLSASVVLAQGPPRPWTREECQRSAQVTCNTGERWMPWRHSPTALGLFKLRDFLGEQRRTATAPLLVALRKCKKAECAAIEKQQDAITATFDEQVAAVDRALLVYKKTFTPACVEWTKVGDNAMTYCDKSIAEETIPPMAAAVDEAMAK